MMGITREKRRYEHAVVAMELFAMLPFRVADPSNFTVGPMTSDDPLSQMLNPVFIPVCCYGRGMVPVKGELGTMNGVRYKLKTRKGEIP